MDDDEIRDRAIKFTKEDEEKFQKDIKEFIEEAPLYSKRQFYMPGLGIMLRVDVASLPCAKCKTIQAFREPGNEGMIRFKKLAGSLPGPTTSYTKGIASKELILSGMCKVYLMCSGCNVSEFHCYLCVDTAKETIMKVGQYPQWVPQIPTELKDELGDDAELYLKALRNMNESYGIGACAYFRRLVEKYINPLLELLYEIKQEAGATADELKKIQDVIGAKEYARKMEVAIEITPKSIEVEGMNPVKKLHELLSISLHNLDDEEAMAVATGLSCTLQYVIRQLRSHHTERKQFLKEMRKISRINLDKGISNA